VRKCKPLVSGGDRAGSAEPMMTQLAIRASPDQVDCHSRSYHARIEELENLASGDEGEGNKTAAGNYNKAQRRFVESGQVEEAARDAERALDGPERQKLLDAEIAGKSRAAEEDPQIERIRARAYEIWEREGRPNRRHDDHWRQAETEIASEKS
jgi:hypothetical protein